MITINFIAESRSTTLSIDGSNSPTLASELVSIFSPMNDDGSFNLKELQSNSQDIRNKIEGLIIKYSSASRNRIYGLRDYFRDLQEGELFFIIPNEISQKEGQEYHKLLMALKTNNPTAYLNDIKTTMNEICKNYNITIADSKEKHSYGEKDKTKRICRYCRKMMPDVHYKKIAHTISEALGNNSIITNDECDECNEKFGQIIEQEFINYHSFFRVFYSISGKTGLIKYKGTNFEICQDEYKNIHIKYNPSEDDKKILEDEDTIRMILNDTQRFIPQNLYKTLCKYAIGIMNENMLPQFESTIEWINGNHKLEVLPKIAYMFPTGFKLPHPRLMLLTRSNDNNRFPYSVGIFDMVDICYIYIIPSSKDLTDFTKDDNYSLFWEEFHPFCDAQGWVFKDLSSIKHQNITVNIQMNGKVSESTISDIKIEPNSH